VPLAHLRPLARVARSVRRSRAARRALGDRLRDLEPDDRAILEAFVRDGLSPRGVAARLGEDESALYATVTRTLRRLDGVLVTSESDAAIGAYLLSTDPPAERDALARRLWAAGVDALDLAALEDTLEQLRATPRDHWPR
jgi:hypothetical protein